MMKSHVVLSCLLFAALVTSGVRAGGHRQILQATQEAESSEQVYEQVPEAEVDQLKADQSLIDSAEAGELDEVEEALADEASIRATDGFGWTALHYAAFSGSPGVVKFLLKSGADVAALSISSSRKKGVFTGEQSTPLHVAAAFGNQEVVKILLENGAAVDARDLRGWTPLARAVRYGRAEVVQTLIDGGAAVNDEGNLSPLHLAALLGEASVADVLIQAGANVDGKTSTGSTPLHYAAEYGHVDVVELLLANSADKEVTNVSQKTPRELICSKTKSCSDEDKTKIEEALKA